MLRYWTEIAFAWQAQTEANGQEEPGSPLKGRGFDELAGMRPEQRQRLAVLVDTAIVKVGLASDFICHKAQHSERGCAVLLPVIDSWDGALPCVPCHASDRSQQWPRTSWHWCIACSCAPGAVGTATVQLGRSLCLSGRVVR